MASSQIQALLGQMQKTLECSICLEMMTNPVSTSCGHQFCRFCLMEFLDRKKQVPCPLCKKTITKRSLTDREQLGEMVQGVRNIITAFQKDTGVLFSPPRGPQTSIIPGTPESIKKKTAAKGANSDKRKMNTRQSRKSQSGLIEDIDNVTETSIIKRVESTALNDKSNAPHSNERKRKSHSMTRKSKTPNETVNGVEKVNDERQTELLKCIAEGHHGTNMENDNDVEVEVIENDNSEIRVEGNSASTSGIESKFSPSPVTSSNEICEGLLSSKKKKLFAKESIDVGHDNKVADVDSDNDNVSEVELIGVENVNVKPDRTVNTGSSPDDNNTELSGLIDVDSQASSGPLFKTPIDLKSCGRKKSEFKEPVVNMKRSLRSRKGVVNYETDNDEFVNDSEVNLTPEVEVAKEKRMGKTYSKKDKESHMKEKKSTKKVAEWLKNISEPSLIDNSVKADTMRKDEQQKVKKSNKLSTKLQKEEQKMGNKMKHLAQLIQNKEKNLLLGYDDFDCVEDTKEQNKGLADDHATVDIKDVDESSNHEENIIDTQVESTELDNLGVSTFTGAKTDSKDDVCTDSNMYNGNVGEGLGDDSTVSDLKRDELPKVLNKKRIFKSRASKSSEIIDNPDKAFTENEKVKQPVSDNKADLDKNEENVQGSVGIIPSTDPYEFKSSQPTPNKAVNKKSKGMKNKKAASTMHLKTKSSAKKKVTLEVMEDGKSEGNVDKIWNKNLKPDKTILKNKSDTNEINAFSAELQQAESYDLLLSTQEAADCIDKEVKKQQQLSKSDDQPEKSTVSRKRVRFSEPTISDFVSSSHIDIIGYRKAKDEFMKEAKSTADLSVDKETDLLNVYHTRTEKQKETQCIRTDLTKKSENTSHDIDMNSEVKMVDDDSSGTDDLDIEPAYDEIEQPNFDIQPDEVKVRLSQDLGEMIFFDKKNVATSSLAKCKSKEKSKNCPNARSRNAVVNLDNESVTCVADTPQIPLNKESPVINVVEETPMITSIPKFNKKLSKPLKMSRRINSKSPKSAMEPVIDEKSVNTNEKILKGFDAENEVDKNENYYADNVTNSDSKGDKSRVFLDELPFLDSVKKSVSDVSASLESTQPPDTETVTNDESELYGNEKETEYETSADFDKTCSDSLSQKSDLILHAKVSPAKRQVIQKSPNKENNSVLDTNDKMSIGDDKVDDRSENEEEIFSKNDNSLCSSNHSRIVKKKRKSFMLEENEESLDFGSLNVEIVSPKTEREIKRKRKRSGNSKFVKNEDNKKTTVKVDGKLVKRTVGKCQSAEIENENIAIVDQKQSESVDIIPDSISYSSVELSKSNNHDGIPAKGQSSSVNFNVCESVDSPSDAEKKKRNTKTDIQATEEVTVIEETECNIVEDSYTDVEFLGCQSENNSRNRKSPYKQKSRRKKNSGEIRLNSNTGASEKEQHSSGLLISPEESMKSSEDDGQINDVLIEETLMPSVDSSPLEGTIRTESPDSEIKSSCDNKNALENNDKKGASFVDNEKLDKISECGSSSKRLTEDPDSSPDNKKRRSSIKAVRGFAKRKLRNQKSSPVCSGISPSPMAKHVVSSNIDNVSKYSPSGRKLLSKQLEIGVNSKKIQPEIIEMEGDSAEDEEDVIVMSPYDLPDLDNKSQNRNKTDEPSDKVAKLAENRDVDDNSVVDREITSSQGKKSFSYLEDKNTIPETLSPTDDVINKLSQQSHRSELDDKQDNETEINSLKDHVESDDGSVDSSSEFNLDSSGDEGDECSKKEALNVISNYNKIVRRSLDLENGKMNDSIEANTKVSGSKCGKRQQNDKHLDKDVVDFNAADIYSCDLDSSPIEEDSGALVVLESDVEDSDENETSEVTVKTNKAVETVETDDSDNEMANVVRKKRAKRAIISDSSSEDDGENSQHMNLTSSSAFSSQSENMNTQEREALEKDLERMAAEMKAMKEQLRKSKGQSTSKDTKVKMDKSQIDVVDVIVDDDDDHSIQDLISDASEEDFFLSQPPFDNHNEDVECVDNEDDSKMECTLHDDSLQTVPESQPTHSPHQSIDVDDAACEGDKTPEEKKRDIGIVVTGLNMSQVRDTKKLAAMNGCKFFNKFNDSVTHVVVKPADDDDAMCDRTLKFFQGIARKCWIVNYFWIVDSREVGRLLPEGPYEIQGDTANNNTHFGPKKSRLSKEHQLFSTFRMALVGDNAFLSKDSMADLIKTCGGHVLDLAKLDEGHKKSFVISCADLEDDDERTLAVKQAKKTYKNHGFIMLTREWVLDSLTLYTIQPIQEYVVTDIPSNKLPKI